MGFLIFISIILVVFYFYKSKNKSSAVKTSSDLRNGTDYSFVFFLLPVKKW